MFIMRIEGKYLGNECCWLESNDKLEILCITQSDKYFMSACLSYKANVNEMRLNTDRMCLTARRRIATAIAAWCA